MQKLGLYIHYPFCSKICPYCDFNVYSNISIDSEILFQAYERDLEYFANKMLLKDISTIYFGGGTPSLMSIFLIEKILKKIDKLFNIQNCIEISFETNPNDISEKMLLDLKSLGVNRISIGIQSLNDRDLAFLGREHDAKKAINSLEMIEKHFNNYTFDLIYALPNQNLKQWDNILTNALSLKSPHMSLYTLTIEEGTPFSRFVKNGSLKVKSEDEIAEFIEFTWNKMKDCNFEHYEVSNFALNKNFKSNHNKIYWNSDDYIGIGAGASGRLFYRNFDRFEIKVDKNLKNWLYEKNPYEEIEISKSEQAKEIFISGLRTLQEINFIDINKRFNLDLQSFINFDNINELINNNLIFLTKTGILITERGLLFLNHIYYKLIL
jgi:putative oxygen-independent coproporphyrinogen III oxidase